MRANRDVNIKKINVEAITLVFLERVRWSVCVCIANILYSSEVTVLEIRVMVGTWPLGLLQRWSIPVPTESRTNLHFIFPYPEFCAFACECLFETSASKPPVLVLL